MPNHRKMSGTGNRSARGQCAMCCKNTGNYREGCEVFTEFIGEMEECSGFTDDPEWEQRVEEEVVEYARKWGTYR